MNIINNYCDTVTGNFMLFCFSFFIKILCHFVLYFIIFSLFLFFVMILINNIIFTFIPLTVLLFYSLLSAGVVFLIFFIIDIVLNLGFNFEFFNLINTWIVSSYEYPSNFIIYEIDPKILTPLHEISENAIKNLIKGDNFNLEKGALAKEAYEAIQLSPYFDLIKTKKDLIKIIIKVAI
jgi:hypothetical protein